MREGTGLMRGLIPVAVAIATAACAQTKSANGAGNFEVISPKNGAEFDLQVCRTREPITPRSSQELAGVLQATAPYVRECLVDPRSREDEPWDALVTGTLHAPQATYDLSASGISEAGKTCILTVARGLGINDATPLKAEPRAASGEMVTLDYPVPKPPQPVSFGTTPSEEAAGTIRRDQRLLCACYLPFVETYPPEWEATVRLHADRAPDFEVHAANPTFANCMQDTLGTLRLPRAESTFIYRPYLLNSNASEATPGYPPEIQMKQLATIFEQRGAELRVAPAQREEAAKALADVAVVPSVAHPERYLRQVKERCNGVVAVDRTWFSTLAGYRSAAVRALDLLPRLEEPRRGPSKDAQAKSLRETLDELQKRSAIVAMYEADDTFVCDGIQVDTNSKR